MKTIKDFLDSFQKAMSAAAFAESGEFETARQLLSVNKNANKRILLGVDDTASLPQTVRYAVNLCKRLGAGLEVLHLVDVKQDNQKSDQQEDMADVAKLTDKLDFARAGITYHPTFSRDSLEEEVARYVQARRDILFVVLNPDARQERKKGTHFACLLKKLKCPVVVPEPL